MTVTMLTGDQVEAALYAVADCVGRRRLENRPVPGEVVALHHRLLIASDCGTEIQSDIGQLEGGDDFIGSSETAAILRCSTRWVRTIHADLGGEKIGARYLFRRQHVIDYAEARQHHTTPPQEDESI